MEAPTCFQLIVHKTFLTIWSIVIASVTNSLQNCKKRNLFIEQTILLYRVFFPDSFFSWIFPNNLDQLTTSPVYLSFFILKHHSKNKFQMEKQPSILVSGLLSILKPVATIDALREKLFLFLFSNATMYMFTIYITFSVVFLSSYWITPENL